jgi:hypothetical protein
MNAHTPGPWHWDSDVMFSTSDNVKHVRWRVCTMGKTITQVYRNDEHAEADARLIAAAPQLLEALTDVVRAFELTMRNHFGGEDLDVLAKARAALALVQP